MFLFERIEGLMPLVDTTKKKEELQAIYDEEYEEVVAWHEEEGCGIGSSDMAIILHDAINTFLRMHRLDYKAVFEPRLKVIPFNYNY